MKNLQFQVEIFFGDIIGKDSISPEQITKLINFQPKYCKNFFCTKESFFKPRKDYRC